MSEIELHSEVIRRQSEFLCTLGQSRLRDIFQDIVDERVDAPNLTVDIVFEDYFQGSKAFGAADKDMLLFFTTLCMAFCSDSRIPKDFKADAFDLSASMLWETAFIETIETRNSPTTVDHRLELVDFGSRLLQQGSTLTQKTDMEKTQRMLVRNLFTQVMRDIVAGEVTVATRDELLLSLRNARTQLRFIGEPRVENGLGGEIATLESLWSEYHKIGDKVALPATIRGGDGHFRPEETHDIDILRQRPRDERWIVLTPIEVKNQRITDKMKQRYTKSHLAEVATNGTVTINGDHRQVAV